MHYYQHHIGDWIKDTANLTDSQSMAYLRLCWRYYLDEEPISDPLDDLAFAIGSDVETVRLILRHYFTEAENGWHHKRIDKEIAAYRKKSESARKSANARWKNANAMRTHSERNANEPFCYANQEPITKINNPKAPQAVPPQQGDFVGETERAKREEEINSVISYLNEKAKKDYRLETKSHRKLVEKHLADGYSVSDFRKVIDVKVSEWLGQKGLDQYLRPYTLFGSKFPDYVGSGGLSSKDAAKAEAAKWADPELL